MPNTPRLTENKSWEQLENNMKAWMPKRRNYPSRNAYRAEVLRKLGKFTANNKQEELSAALWALPMGNRVWIYQSENRIPAITAARGFLNPRVTNMLMWPKNRGGRSHYAHRNYVNALQARLNYPRLERTARRIQDPKFMAREYLRRINTPFSTNNQFNTNITNFRNTVRGNVGNASKKLLEIRKKAAKRTIARYVRAGKVGVHISQVRKMRAMNRARGIGVSSKKRAASAPPVLSRRRLSP